MSLAGALYNAFSGLKANSRAASLVSTNIANATTESYGRRELSLSPAAAGTTGGVRIEGVIRHTDPVLFGDRLTSDAQLGYGTDMYTFAKRLESLVGTSGTSGSLTDRVTAFENALMTAASNPASTQRLELVATTGNDLAQTLNVLSEELQYSRQAADTAISTQVDTLNATMVRLDEINGAVISAATNGGDTASLLDERQRLLDQASAIVPLRVVTREKGDIAVFSRGGAILLDGRAFEVGFERTFAIDPSMTLAGGQLNGLTLNGSPIPSTSSGLLSGGSLGAQFEIRDEAAVERQSELDGIARDLIERLDPTGPDPTLGPTDPGLFTDTGLAFNPADETGISARIALNSLVAPGSGGSWRLRDGLGAATTGQVGDARLLQDISDALTSPTVPGSSALPSLSRSFIDHVSEFSSAAAGERVRRENTQTFLTTQNLTLKELELSKGVDTDQELQRLMQIEQHYAANAQVMSTVDELLQRLMSI